MTAEDRAQVVPEDRWWERYDDPPVALHPLLRAALDLFVQYGFHATSVRAIAAEAGMTVPSLYNNFDSKQDVLAELLSRSNHELARRSEAAVAAAEPNPRARFAALVRTFVLHMTYMRKFAHLVRDIDSLDASHRRRHVELRDQFQRMVLTEVIGGQALRDFAPSDAHETTRAVLTMCGAVADWFHIDGAASPEAIADRYVEYALTLVLDRAHLDRVTRA